MMMPLVVNQLYPLALQPFLPFMVSIWLVRLASVLSRIEEILLPFVCCRREVQHVRWSFPVSIVLMAKHCQVPLNYFSLPRNLFSSFFHLCKRSPSCPARCRSEQPIPCLVLHEDNLSRRAFVAFSRSNPSLTQSPFLLLS